MCKCFCQFHLSVPTDINKDAVTFLGTRSSYLYFTRLASLNLLSQTLIFNFRTFLRSTLLLYIHDHLNNFLSVELQENRRVVAKFNRYNTILEQVRELPGTTSHSYTCKQNKIFL